MTYDTIIVGAGIVGLATAHQILKQRPGARLAILEKESHSALHQTGNNSGVLHSGVYYKPGSHKATNCRRGYQLMLEFLQENQIPHEICGKLIVATNKEEMARLETLKARGEQNGLSGLKLLGPQESREIEPHVNALQSLQVPQAGIVDYKAVCKVLEKKVLDAGGEIKFNTKVLKVSPGQLQTGHELYEYEQLINCAGLYSDRLSSDRKNLQHRIVPFRGEYYELKPEREHLVKHLIYPVPDDRFPFLGVHFTRMIGGGVEAGPNAVLALSREGYSWGRINLADLAESLAWPGFQKLAIKYWRVGCGEVMRSLSKSLFTKALQKLIPEIRSEDLVPGGAGVRAQALARTGGLVDDFLVVKNEKQVHVYNAPSPGATSSLAIGEYVSEKAFS